MTGDTRRTKNNSTIILALTLKKTTIETSTMIYLVTSHDIEDIDD